MRVLVTGAVLAMLGGSALAGDKGLADTTAAEMFKGTPPALADRIGQDATQAACSQARDRPSEAEAAAIVAREGAAVRYPEDGRLLGDWKKGEALAETGSGGQFTDKAETAHGGNCYACHQMAASELSYGTLGPSLQGYGKAHGFSEAAARAAYGKIYNSNAFAACSQMPRYGANGFLSVEQIKDLAAYLMAPDSPVNK